MFPRNAQQISISRAPDAGGRDGAGGRRHGTGAAQDRLRQRQPAAGGSAAGPGAPRPRSRTSSRAVDAISENQQKELKTREEKLQKDGAVMAENERRNAEKTLRDGQRELARKQNEFLEDLNVRRNEALGQLQRTVVAGNPGLREDRWFRHGRGRCALRQPGARHHRAGADRTAIAPQDPGAREALTRRRIRIGAARANWPYDSAASCAAIPTPRSTTSRRLQDARPGSLAFLANPRYGRHLPRPARPAVVLDASRPMSALSRRWFIRIPYATYARMAAAPASARSLRHRCAPAAVVEPGAPSIPTCLDRRRLLRRGRGAHRGRAFPGTGLHSARPARASPRTRGSSPGSRLCDDVRIGARCLLHPGSVIGADGFGHAPDAGAT